MIERGKLFFIFKVFLIVLIISFILGCKKEKVDVIIDLSRAVQSLDIQKSYIFESGKDGFQYAYGTVNVLNENEVYITAVRYPKILSDFKEKAEIISTLSKDNGFNWGDTKIVQTNIGLKNTSNPSVIKISNDQLFMNFSAVNSTSNIDLYYKQSIDNGETWSTPIGINESGQGYHVAVNDRLVFNNRRLFLPAAYVDGDIFEKYEDQEVIMFVSDNYGKSWKKNSILKSNHSLMEPNLVFINSEEAIINMRTKLGYVYFGRSTDGGGNWFLQKSNIESPASPQKIVKIPGKDILVMIWNNNRENFRSSFNNRSPLSIAISKDKGYNWTYLGDIEDSKEFDYAYPSISFSKEEMFVLYYEREKITNNKSSLKLARLPLKSLLNTK